MKAALRPMAPHSAAPRIARSVVCVALALVALASTAHTQTLRFSPTAAGAPLLLNIPYTFNTQQAPITITTLRAYISRIALYRSGARVWSEPASYHLLDADDTAGWQVNLSPPPGTAFDELRYTIGIDSATNAGGAKGGALDAMLGMYWAWHSGYINVKLEGTNPAMNTRGHRFEYHLGGYGPGKDCAVEQRIAARPGHEVIIPIRLDKFFENISSPEPSIMTPGADAQRLSRLFAQCFQTGAAQ